MKYELLVDPHYKQFLYKYRTVGQMVVYTEGKTSNNLKLVHTLPITDT